MENDRPPTFPIRIRSQSRVFGLSKVGTHAVSEPRCFTRGYGVGSEILLAVRYIPCEVHSYHKHTVGREWIPTAPKSVVGATSIQVRELLPKRFVTDLPNISLSNSSLRRWFPRNTTALEFRLKRYDLIIGLEQSPAIEGIRGFDIQGNLTGPLTFLDGKVILDVGLSDVFGSRRRSRIYHDGFSAARFGIQHSSRFNAIESISYDGVRLRFLYRANRTALQAATVYICKPGVAYELTHPPCSKVAKSLVSELKPEFVLGVKPIRNLETVMIEHGSLYDHGTIGAEIAYSISSGMLPFDEMVMREPSMGGPDILSKDRSVAVEARMLAGRSAESPFYASTTADPHMRQMLRRIRRGLARRDFRRGLAILSIRLGRGRILTLIKEG